MNSPTQVPSVNRDKNGLNHIPALDGVRGLAILLVILQHFSVIDSSSPASQYLLPITGGGWIGVDLFFVLSGFLITSILISTRSRSDYFSRFYIRRAFRILPLFLLLAIFSFIVLPYSNLLPQNKAERFGTVGSDQWMYWLFLSNVAVARFGAWRHGIMDVTWSLAIEEQFYILWPLVVLIFRHHLLKICFGIIAISAMSRLLADFYDVDRNIIYVFTIFRLDGLSSGAALAVLFDNSQGKILIKKYSGTAFLIGLIGFSVVGYSANDLSYYYADHMITFGIVFVTIGFAGLVGYIISKTSSTVTKFISSKFFVFIGSISYCLYLIHLPIRAAVRDLILTPEWISSTPGGGLVGQLLFYLVCGVICVAVAWASKILIESRLIELGRRLTSTPPP